jgi:hypothetical protein
VALLIGAGAAVGGYALGTSSAPTSGDFAREASDAQSDSFKSAQNDAFKLAYARGQDAGSAAGRSAGAQTGAQAGERDGGSGADQAVAASSPPVTTLPDGQPGYVLPESQRTLGCVGINASTGQCVGD